MTDHGLEIEKFIVSPDDELVDLLKEVENTKASRIILTFAEPSDLLISPINLKVIQDSADSLKKPLIALIVQNPTGVRNAKEAGMTVTESSGSIIDTFWEQAQQKMEKRIEEKKNNLKNGRAVKQAPIEEEEEELVYPEEDNSFSKRINEAIQKSKDEMSKKRNEIEQNGVLLKLDQEIEDLGPSLLGKNFSKQSPQKKETSKSMKLPFNLNLPKLDNFKIPEIKLPKNLSGWALKIGAPLFLILALSAYIAYVTLPLAKVQIYVESKEVSIEKNFTGDTKTEEFDLEKGKVPVKKSNVTKSASDSIQATGTGYKGTKAEGVVTLSYWTYLLNGKKIIDLKAGTILNEQSGFKFELTADVSLGQGGVVVTDVPVRATQVGEEYNLAAGQYFEIEGVSKNDVTGSNSAPFEGGTKTPYTVLSQADVDKVVNKLKKNMFSDAELELNQLQDDTWTIIPKSIESNLDGDPETDVPIGAEADTVNVTVKAKSTALFYQFNAIDSLVESMLTQAAQDKGLFEGTTSESLNLEENINKEVKVTDIKKDVIKVQLKASSNIQPGINRDELLTKLKGKSWNEGLAIIMSMKFTERENSAQFLPEYFPEWLRYFPTKQGRLFIDIVKVTPEQDNN